MRKGDIVKFVHPVDDAEAKERSLLLEDPDGGRVLVEAICNLDIKPTRFLKIADLVVDKRKTAFRQSRLLSCGNTCDGCGQFKMFPEGVALYEEPYSAPKWLCEDCFPEVCNGNED